MIPIPVLLLLAACGQAGTDLPRIRQGVGVRVSLDEADAVVIGRMAHQWRFRAQWVDGWHVYPEEARIAVEAVLKGRMAAPAEIRVRSYAPAYGGSFSTLNRLTAGERYLFLLRRTPRGWRALWDVYRWSWRTQAGIPSSGRPQSAEMGERVAAALLQPGAAPEAGFLEPPDANLAFVIAGPSVWVPILQELAAHPNAEISRRACVQLGMRFPFATRCAWSETAVRWRRELLTMPDRHLDAALGLESAGDREFVRIQMRAP